MMELFVIAILLTFAGAQQSQLEGPQNTLSVVGSTVTLKCLSPSRNCNGIDWQKYIPGASPATIFKGPSTMLNTNVTDRDRYSVDNSSGCDLVIKNVRLEDAGRFICSAIMSSTQMTKTAYLIILENQPICMLYASEYNTMEGDGMPLKCEVTYSGSNRASLDWKGVTDAPTAVTNRNTINRSYSVVASAPEVPSFTCETSFPLERTDIVTGVAIIGLATNIIPNAICSTSSIKVLYSVRDVTLSSSYVNHPPGTIITCEAKGNPSPTFKWQESDNNVVWMDIRIQNGSRFTSTDLSSKRYRCVAMNVVRGRNYNATSKEIQFDNTVMDVTLSPSLSHYPPGSSIVCKAKGQPPPTFKWQEMENGGTWMDIQNQRGSEFTMTDVYSKRYRCVAMNVVGGRSYNATSNEILVNSTGCLGIGVGIGVGIGFLVAILLATVVFAILVKVKRIEVHPMPSKKSPDSDTQHMSQEMNPLSRQRSPMTGAPLTGEQESTYASLGEDRDVNEYAALGQRQKAK